MISCDEENFEKKNHAVKAMKVNSVYVIFILSKYNEESVDLYKIRNISPLQVYNTEQTPPPPPNIPTKFKFYGV